MAWKHIMEGCGNNTLIHQVMEWYLMFTKESIGYHLSKAKSARLVAELLAREPQPLLEYLSGDRDRLRRIILVDGQCMWSENYYRD